MGLRKSSESQYLIIVDCGDADPEKTKELIQSIKDEAKDIETKETVEYIPASSGIGQTAIANNRPFFQKVIVDIDLDEEED